MMIGAERLVLAPLLLISPWAVLSKMAALILGRGVAAPNASFGMVTGAVALFAHFALSFAYAFLIVQVRMHRDHRGGTMSGEGDAAKGRIKEAAGALTDDDDLRREGKTDQAAGKAKDVVNKAKDKVEDAIDSARDKANRSDDD